MYYATVVAAAVHQFILRSLRDAVTDDQVVVQNVASGEFCVLFVDREPRRRAEPLVLRHVPLLVFSRRCDHGAGERAALRAPRAVET